TAQPKRIEGIDMRKEIDNQKPGKWKEVLPKKEVSWPPGVRLPIIISVHHQSEEACVALPDGQIDPRDYYERQYGGKRGAWRLLEIMTKHNVKGRWIIAGAPAHKTSQ